MARRRGRRVSVDDPDADAESFVEGGEALARLLGRSQRPSDEDSRSAAVRVRVAGDEWQFIGVIFADCAERDARRRSHVAEFATFADDRALALLVWGGHLSPDNRGTIRWPQRRETPRPKA